MYAEQLQADPEFYTLLTDRGKKNWVKWDIVENFLTNLHKTTIQWNVADFILVAQRKLGLETDSEAWKEVYDETTFPKALEQMIGHHDPEVGINWDTVSYYLDTRCRVALKTSPLAEAINY